MNETLFKIFEFPQFHNCSLVRLIGLNRGKKADSEQILPYGNPLTVLLRLFDLYVHLTSPPRATRVSAI
jgi:hypothetical protein